MKNRRKSVKIINAVLVGGFIIDVLIISTVVGRYFLFLALPEETMGVFLSSIVNRIILFSVIIAFVTWKMGKKLSKPLINMHSATQEVIKGNYSVRIPTDSGITEINNIATDFNIMVKELGNTEMLKDDFISNVSHEFKTPLSVIQGYVSLLQGEISQEEKDTYIKIVMENTEKLSTLTGNILALSKLSHQSIPLEKEQFRVDKQICDTIVDFNEQWEEKEIEVEMNLEAIEIYGYRSLLPRVWGNLIQNAIKFSERGGHIKIICRHDRESVMLSFIDTGIGMNKDTLTHVFDKFYQGEKSRSTAGNGLGLALVKQIVEISDGEIYVESELGKGSTFTVTLPIHNY